MYLKDMPCMWELKIESKEKVSYLFYAQTLSIVAYDFL